MNKNLKGVTWFLITLAGCIFTMAIFYTVEGAPKMGWIAAVLMLVIQLAGLLYYMHAKPDAVLHGPLKILIFLLHLSVLGVVLILAVSVFSLANEYHNPVDAGGESGENITVETTDDLYIMYPSYSDVEFVTGDSPSRSDTGITFCGAATFQETYNFSFDPAELPGTYVSGGQKYTGYELDGLGVFAFYDDTFHFADEEEADAEIENALEAGGSAFRQFIVIEDGEIVCIPESLCRCFRVLAELDGRLCVIDSSVPVLFTDFAEELQSIGVTNAIYMDMGRGWNYSWYRNNGGEAKTLIGMVWPFSHNWVVFKK